MSELFSQIISNNLSGLEEILKNKEILREYNKEVSECTQGQETLLSALLHKLKDTYYKHKICCLFLKYGLTLSTIVSNNCNVIEFFCGLKKTHSGSNKLRIICLLVFAFKNEISFTQDKCLS